jgi:hypothetical protein
VLSVGCGFIVAAVVVIAIVTSFVESPANRLYKEHVLTSEGEIAQIEGTYPEILVVHRKVAAGVKLRALAP